MIKMHEAPAKKPSWIKVKLKTTDNFRDMKNLMSTHTLNTVCEEARCPNIYECWDNRTATVMILGDVCTRSCGFCSIKTGKPLDADLKEPYRVADFVKKLKLRHVVITSVDRDDLKDDFGAEIWKQTIDRVHQEVPSCTVEVLTPDFRGYKSSLDKVFNARPEIFSHNVECVKRISKDVRAQSDWNRTLDVLKMSVDFGLLTKTGMMVGLGEKDSEVFETMEEIAEIGVRIFNIGQYLQPSKDHIPVSRFVHPDQFKVYKEFGLELGFKVVESGPLVRSSYHADEQIKLYNN